VILGFIGGMGSGKSLSMVRQAYSYYLQGYTVYSNMKLNFPYVELTLDLLLQYSNDDIPFYDSVLLIDEIHIFMDSRRSGSIRNVLISYFITQTRKQKVKLMYTTQYLIQVDKRLRQNTSALTKCRQIKVGNGLMVTYNIIVTEEQTFKDYFVSNKYYGLYDTEEIIKLTTTNKDLE